MPYKIEYTHQKLPRELDRRVKLTDSDKEEILNLFKEGWSQRSIGFEYNVSRRLIYWITHPDKYEIAKAQYKERRSDGRYYDREKHNKSMQSCRVHRKKNIPNP